MTVFRILIAAFVGLWQLSALAQSPPTPTNTTSPDQQGQTVGGTNSGARDNRINPQGQGDANDPNAVKNDSGNMNTTGTPAGPDIADDSNATPEEKASAEYSGPAVLSRGISASEPMNPKNVRFTPTVGVEYVYNAGLTGVSLQPNGQLSNANSSGVQLTYGLTGTKVYRKDTVSLSFSGSVYDYLQQSSYNGSSNSLALTWRHKLSRHFSFGVSVSGQEYNQNNLLLSGAGYVNSGVGTTLVTATPATEAFDGRVFSFSTQGDVTYQMTSRVSINMSGGGFLTRRESTSLYGDTGYQAGADIAYRITRHVTTGVYYGYTHFDYLGIYGSTNVNTVGLTYSIAFTPTTELITRVGASRLATAGLTSVTLDPLFALLFGTGAVQEAVYLVNYTPDVNVQLRRKVSKVALSLAYARGITPGNGVILTSVRQTASVGADYKLGRNWHFSDTSGYDTLSSFGVTNQKYTSVFVGSNVYRTIHRGLDWHARFDFHRYLFDNTAYLRNNFVLSTGLVWSPGDVLDRVW